MTKERIEELAERVLASGEGVSREEAVALAGTAELDALCDSADRIARKHCGDTVDSCSIVNARSGLCSEDCKWCAQSVKYATGCDVYPIVPEEKVLEAARHNSREGIQRFSLVTSGKKVGAKEMPAFCDLYKKVAAETGLYLCASMGLLWEEELKMLKDAGVKRYHCNVESSSRYFRTLCSTHTPEEKHATIRAAKKLGMAVCSGGIIGMGESMEDRIDMALELRELDVDSVPINILNPIPGTPLADTPLISEEEVVRTVAVMRFLLPTKSLRFAGGRMRLSAESMSRIMKGGMNGVLMGDMLTTISNQISDDRKLFKETGWKF